MYARNQTAAWTSVCVWRISQALRSAGAAQTPGAEVAEPAKAPGRVKATALCTGHIWQVQDKDIQEQGAPTSEPSELAPTTAGGRAVA